MTLRQFFYGTIAQSLEHRPENPTASVEFGVVPPEIRQRIAPPRLMAADMVSGPVYRLEHGAIFILS